MCEAAVRGTYREGGTGATVRRGKVSWVLERAVSR